MPIVSIAAITGNFNTIMDEQKKFQLMFVYVCINDNVLTDEFNNLVFIGIVHRKVFYKLKIGVQDVDD